MNKEDFDQIEIAYNKTKEDFQKRDSHLLAKDIASELEDFSPTIEEVFDFLIQSFKGSLRRDEKTPLVFHSIFLTKILKYCSEENINTFLLASLHDVLEDTSVNENILKNKSFLKNREYLIDYLKILKEDQSLSREPDGKTLPKRYKEHIKRMIDAPKEVINVEILDRFSDLMDLDYILKLPKPERDLRLRSKIIKVRSFIENITRNRDDINKNCLDLCNYKIKEIQALYDIKVNIPIISK